MPQSWMEGGKAEMSLGESISDPEVLGTDQADALKFSKIEVELVESFFADAPPCFSLRQNLGGMDGFLDRMTGFRSARLAWLPSRSG